MDQKISAQTIDASDAAFVNGSETLKRGIWPRRLSLWMAAIYVVLFIIQPWDQIFPWLGVIHFERIYFILMLIVLFSSSDRQSIKMNSQTFAVILFFISIFLSAIFAYDSRLSWTPLYVYFTTVAFYFIILAVIKKPYDLMFLIITYILSMTVYLAKSQWEFFVHDTHEYRMGVIRLVGIDNTFGGPNNLAMSIVVSLPMLIFLWLNRKRISSTWPNFYKKWFPRVLIIYTLLAVSSIILTNSRSGMVTFVFFLLLIALFRKQKLSKKILYVIIMIFTLMSLWAVMSDEHRNRLKTVWDPKAGPVNAQASAEGRIQGYKAGIAMFMDSPLVGIGIGNFIKYRVEKFRQEPLNAHNLVGQVLGETGVLGMIAFLLVVLITIKNTRLARKMSLGNPSQENNTYSQLAFAIRDSVLILFFTGLFGHNLYRFNWLWLAAFSVHLDRFVIESLGNQMGIKKT
jgi:O-antigen ligase